MRDRECHLISVRERETEKSYKKQSNNVPLLLPNLSFSFQIDCKLENAEKNHVFAQILETLRKKTKKRQKKTCSAELTRKKCAQLVLMVLLFSCVFSMIVVKLNANHEKKPKKQKNIKT